MNKNDDSIKTQQAYWGYGRSLGLTKLLIQDFVCTP